MPCCRWECGGQGDDGLIRGTGLGVKDVDMVDSDQTAILYLVATSHSPKGVRGRQLGFVSMPQVTWLGASMWESHNHAIAGAMPLMPAKVGARGMSQLRRDDAVGRISRKPREGL